MCAWIRPGMRIREAQSSSVLREGALRDRVGRFRISAMRPSDTTTSASSTRRAGSSVTTRAPASTRGRAGGGRFGGTTAVQYRPGTRESQPPLYEQRRYVVRRYGGRG